MKISVDILIGGSVRYVNKRNGTIALTEQLLMSLLRVLKHKNRIEIKDDSPRN